MDNLGRDSLKEPADNDFLYEINDTNCGRASSGTNKISHNDRKNNTALPSDQSKSHNMLLNDRSKSPSVPSGDISDNYRVSSIDGSDRRHAVLTKHSQKRSTSVWKRKKLWIGVIGGSLLTTIIVVPALYFITKSDESSKGNAQFFQLTFDQSTLHQSVFMSDDGLILSNTFSKTTTVSSVINQNTLNQYRGVIGNKCFDKNSKIYFEVEYEFSVTGRFDPSYLIFEVGLAERRRVDNYHYVGTTRTTGWSYHLHICSNTSITDGNICLSAEHNGKTTLDQISWHQIVVGSKRSGKFGFIVNTRENTFSTVLSSPNHTSIVHSFQNVYSVSRLCPVFGVFNPNIFEVKLALSNTYEFSGAVWNIVFI